VNRLKPLVFAASLAPAAYWVWAASTHQLNANPFNAIVRDTGFWSLRFLCLTVAVTPLRWLTRWHPLVKFRRMLGLFAFFYGVIHLAATSTVGMIRRLGGPRWQALHRLVYPAAISGVVHTYWPWTTHAPRYAVLQSHPRRARGPCVRANAICYTAFRSLTRPCEVAKR
jgi:sulfoxide reductase heme-binding subunit YedZ